MGLSRPRIQFIIDRLKVGDLSAVLEILADAGGGVLAEGLPDAGFAGEAVEVVEKTVAVALPDEEAGLVIGDGFGDATVVGGENRQAGGHGFQHGVGNAFLILVRGRLAGMEESVGVLIQGAEGLGVEEAGECDFFGDVEFGATLLEFREEGAIAGDGEVAFPVGFAKLRKGLEGDE